MLVKLWTSGDALRWKSMCWAGAVLLAGAGLVAHAQQSSTVPTEIVPSTTQQNQKPATNAPQPVPGGGAGVRVVPGKNAAGDVTSGTSTTAGATAGGAAQEDAEKQAAKAGKVANDAVAGVWALRGKKLRDIDFEGVEFNEDDPLP
ncbi:MAG: hypothetical protein V4734_01885, partial [Terriglobus sp.]